MNTTVTSLPRANPVAIADLISAGSGLLLWALLLTLRPMDIADAVLVLAPLVIVPLGLRVLNFLSEQHRECLIFRTGHGMQFPAAVVFATGWMTEDDVLQNLAAIPWMIVTSLFAFSSIRIISRRRRISITEFTLCAALLFIAVGGGWSLFYRIRYCPFDFPLGIVKLTGVHFHYAGFALPILAAAALKDERPDLAFAIAICITLGMPVVAIGITLSPIIELIGAVILALACMRLSMIVIRHGFGSKYRTVQSLLVIAGLSLFVSMCLAIVYAVGEYREVRWLGIQDMLLSHGPLNAFGFGLCGLVAFNLKLYFEVGKRAKSEI